MNHSDAYGPRKAHLYGQDESKGVIGTPFDSPQTYYSLYELFVPRVNILRRVLKVVVTLCSAHETRVRK